MEHKIFLGTYRVAADEMAVITAAPSNGADTALVATEPPTGTRAYRGKEIDSGREVTVEVIPGLGFKTSVREGLEAEAITAKKINHANIPALYDFGIEDDQLIYVTEYFDGSSAEDWVNEHGPMPTGAVLRIAMQVLGAMGAASFHKISHHAINPGNLMLVPGQTPEGDWPLVKVLHFVGVAPTFATADTSVASFDKSTHYASPEQLRDGTVDLRSEIYSLGATMWFLLTGAPPLMAPKGPLALQPSTIGLTVDKLNGMPKKVRRLLSRMLSADPAGRPQDALALYRQIQECIAQIDRRETMARRLGVPFLSRSKVVDLPTRKRFPVRALALAAILAAMATVGAVAFSQYLRHQRVRQAEEPIGVPIGVPDATTSAPPVTANASPVASAPPAVANAPTVAPAAPPVTENTPAVASAPAVKPLPTAAPVVAQENQPPAPTVESTPAVIARNEPSVPPVQPEATAPPADSQPAEPPRVAANKSHVIRETNPAPQPAESVHREVREPEPSRDRNAVAAIPTARPVSPEVRRAEPPSPAQGPDEETNAETEKKFASNSKPKKEHARKPKRETKEKADTEDETIPRSEPGPDQEVADASLPELPKGRTRARFIGVTADGNWMFSLPSKKIVIVPPPPGG
jgi:serine/threonine protein kinase